MKAAGSARNMEAFFIAENHSGGFPPGEAAGIRMNGNRGKPRQEVKTRLCGRETPPAAV